MEVVATVEILQHLRDSAGDKNDACTVEISLIKLEDTWLEDIINFISLKIIML